MNASMLVKNEVNIYFLMGLGRMLNYVHVNGQDLAAAADGVIEYD